MNIIKRIKLWWKSTPLTTKIFLGLGVVTAGAGIAAVVSSAKKPTQAENTALPEPESEPAPKNEWVVDPDRSDWEVWNPSWECKYESASGWEDEKLADALEVLNRMDGMMRNDGYCNEEDVHEAAARVEDLARQFAYLNQAESGNEFRKRFPDQNKWISNVYTNVELKTEEPADEKKGE